jgi:hypothetical protein
MKALGRGYRTKFNPLLLPSMKIFGDVVAQNDAGASSSKSINKFDIFLKQFFWNDVLSRFNGDYGASKTAKS